MAAMESRTGLRNFLNPTIGALASREEDNSNTTSGIPPGPRLAASSWELADCQAMITQTETELGTFSYQVNRNGVLSNQPSSTLPSTGYGVSKPEEDIDIFRRLPVLRTARGATDVAPKPRREASPLQAEPKIGILPKPRGGLLAQPPTTDIPASAQTTRGHRAPEYSKYEYLSAAEVFENQGWPADSACDKRRITFCDGQSHNIRYDTLVSWLQSYPYLFANKLVCNDQVLEIYLIGDANLVPQGEPVAPRLVQAAERVRPRS